MTFLLSVDIGTSSLKAALFDEDLRILAQSKQEYPTYFPGFKRAEQDANTWITAFCTAIHSLLESSKIAASAIEAVSVCGMSSLALPVDASGQPLGPGLIWLDRRAQEESDFIRENHESRQRAISGNRSDPSNFAPKVMWIKKNQTDVYKKAACFLHCNAFLVHWLCGAFTMDVSHSGLSQICDIRTGSYADELVTACGIAREKLPDIVRCSDVVGAITTTAAARCGLRTGTPVIAGAMDNVAATLGLRLRHHGDSYISAGTATNAGILLRAPAFDGQGLLYHSALEGKWLINGAADYGGAGLLWFRNILEQSDFSELGRIGEDTACGEHPLLFLPYMTGQRAPLWNECASGTLFGITPDTERRHLVRMFMESLALASRHVLEKLSPQYPTQTALTGGITHNAQWRQIFADATGLHLSVNEHAEISVLGTAILAGIGIGLFADADDAFSRLPQEQVIVPNTRTQLFYDDLFSIFRTAYGNTLETMAALSTLRHTYEARK